MTLADFSGQKIWLAPLAGYTDRAFRVLCKRHGADVLVSEMVSADGLTRESFKTSKLIHFGEEERPYAVQLFGSDPLVMARGAALCLEFQPDLIDINMGCPVKKVIKRGAGSALMTDPPRAAAIVREVRNALDGRIPLSVKFRSGWDSGSLNYLEFGLLLQDSGVDLICLHPRTAKQMFSGTSNWDHITHLKSRLDIPLIGNGDIDSPEAALRMFEACGCDGIMIGRGALGRPFIFNQIKELISQGIYHPSTRDQLRSIMSEHLELALQFKRETVVVKEMRSQLCHYVKGAVGGAELRRQINTCPDAATLRALIYSFPALK